MAEPARPIAPTLLARIDELVAGGEADLEARYPGDGDTPQPVHTVYVSAADATETTPADWAAPRLEAFLDRRGGVIVDEPATAEALATVVLRGLDVDAFSVDDVLAVAPDADIAVLRNLKERRLS